MSIHSCSNFADQYQVASANVVGGGSGGGDEYSASVEQEANQANIGCVFSSCTNTAYQDQVASANVVGGGSGGSGGDEYSASVEQEANQANIGCVYSYLQQLCRPITRQLVLM